MLSDEDMEVRTAADLMLRLAIPRLPPLMLTSLSEPLQVRSQDEVNPFEIRNGMN